MKKIFVLLSVPLILVFTLVGCSDVSLITYLSEHKNNQEGIAIFEGFSYDRPYYTLVDQDGQKHPHLQGWPKPNVNEIDPTFVGMSFKAYYDPDNIDDNNFWVCVDELLLSDTVELYGYASATLTMVFKTNNYVLVKYRFQANPEGETSKSQKDEFLPIRYYNNLKEAKKRKQKIIVAVYKNPKNPHHPIFRIDRSSLENNGVIDRTQQTQIYVP